MSDLATRLVELFDRKAAEADVRPIEGFAEAPVMSAHATVVDLGDVARRRAGVFMVAALIIASIAATVLVVRSRIVDHVPKVTTPPVGLIGTEFVIRSVPNVAYPDDASGSQTDPFPLVHHLQGFKVAGQQIDVFDGVDVSANALSQPFGVSSFGGGATGSLPLVWTDPDPVRWMAYRDLPSSVAYVTFVSFNGSQMWERPIDGVAIFSIASSGGDVKFLDASLGEIAPQLAELPPLVLLTPVPASINSDSLKAAAESRMSACLKDANFDIHATDTASDRTWTQCLGQAQIGWNQTLSMALSSPSSTP